jgi:hypothetical protein
MRILLDENVDRRLKQHFDEEFEVSTVGERGWSGMRNGDLLRSAAGEFDALVTMDQGIQYQQNLATISLGIVLICARSNRRQDVEPLMPAIDDALRSLQPGTLVRVHSSVELRTAL